MGARAGASYACCWHQGLSSLVTFCIWLLIAQPVCSAVCLSFPIPLATDFHSFLLSCLNTTKALTGMSNLRDMYVDSDMTRLCYGTEVDIMKPIKPLWKYRPGTLLTGFPVALPGEEGRSFPGRLRNLRVF